MLARYLRPQWRRLLALAGFLAAMILAQISSPLIVRRFIDTAAHGMAHGAAPAPLAALWMLAGAFILVAITTQLLQIGATYHSEQLAWAATNKLRADLAAHTLHLDMSYHTATSPGDIIERVDGDVAQLANFFSQFVLQIVGGALLLAGIFAVVMLQDWRIGATLGAVGIVAGLTMHAMRNLASAEWERVRNAFSGFSAYLEERLAGLEDIRANGGGAHAMAGFKRLTDELAAANIVASRRGMWIYLVASGLFSLGFAAALAVGAKLYLERAITIGVQLQQFQQASASLGRIRTLLALGPELLDGPGLPAWRRNGRTAPRVVFEDVSFAYKPHAPVLQDVSLVLEPGAVLGLLGRTGSGKTTLTRLLFRLYDPQRGRVSLDGEDIREATLAELRGRIGLVTQEVQLFDASVRDNATLFDPAGADARIIEVLSDLGLGDWLARQPEGLDTVLVAGGGLSAGEAQLLAFARVFLKDPGLVVLDEASSRLDPASDRLIERALDKLLGRQTGRPRRTAIIIAHKLSTVARADHIVILDHGRVLEAGGRAALEADPSSAFAKLLAAGAEEALA